MRDYKELCFEIIADYCFETRTSEEAQFLLYNFTEEEKKEYFKWKQREEEQY